MPRTNRNNQTTFDVPRAAFDAAGVTVPGGFVRYANDTSANVAVAFGARASAIIAALPAADRPAAIVASVVTIRARIADGGTSGAGAGRIDTHAVIIAGGGDTDAANAVWRRLRRTPTRRAVAKSVVAG